MFFNFPVDFKITPQVKLTSREAKKIIPGIETFLLSMPVIIAEYEKRTLRTAQDAAPQRTGDLAASLETINYGDMGFGLQASPSEYHIDEAFGHGGWVIGSKTRGIMMEFGYPYSNYWGPYLPNPRPGTPSLGPGILRGRDKLGKPTQKKLAAKRGTEAFKGLGYMRISYIVAAESLYTDKVNYNLKGYTLSDVKSYVKRSEENFVKSTKKLLLKFLRNQSLPAYMRKKSVAKAPYPMQLKSFVGFGKVEGLQLNIPINIEGEDYYNRMRTGANLRNATASLNRNSPFVSGYEFAVDDSNLSFIPF